MPRRTSVEPAPDGTYTRSMMSSGTAVRALILGAGLTLATPAWAAGLDGRGLGLVWALPFAGILLSIAILPQVVAHHWEHHLGKIAGAWALLLLVPLALTQGIGMTADAVGHVLLVEYLPFILVLFALYTLAGGIVVTGNLHGSPAVNTGLLAVGTALASVVGTTGASMILIRPVLRANDDRRNNVHVVVFFIFLVSNIGGALTPLGDPPLFLGFLRGVDFFWTTRHLLAETAFVVAALLLVFYLLDRYLYASEGRRRPDPTPDTAGPIGLRGRVNLVLLALLVGAILLSGIWKGGVALRIGSTALEWQNLARDATLLCLALLSLRLSPKANRIANAFTWAPIAEVAKIFAAIFVCLLPVAAILAAGREGALAPLLGLVTRPDGSPNEVAYFWLTGLLSSFLDNAPTYVVFFELAGGDPVRLMGPLAGTLAAISSAAVFMGANTYIGNAPNFMVYAIARGAGVRMPSFLGYMAWSGAVLLPLFGIVTTIFFR